MYATLIAYGHDGYADMLARQITLARSVASYIFHHEAFELLPQEIFRKRDSINQHVFIIVLFRAKDSDLNEHLVERINETRKMYVSGTKWESRLATRIAVSNWQVQPDRDLVMVKSVLEHVLKSHSEGTLQAQQSC